MLITKEVSEDSKRRKGSFRPSITQNDFKINLRQLIAHEAQKKKKKTFTELCFEMSEDSSESASIQEIDALSPDQVASRFGEVLRIMHNGDLFGEVALENRKSKRTASAIALEDSTLLSLNQNNYKRYFCSNIIKDSTTQMDKLRRYFPLLVELPIEARRRLLYSVKEVSYKKREVIIKEGAHPSSYYILLDGEVDLTKSFCPNTIQEILSSKHSLMNSRGYLTQYDNHEIQFVKECRKILKHSQMQEPYTGAKKIIQIAILVGNDAVGDETIVSTLHSHYFTATCRSDCTLLRIGRKELFHFFPNQFKAEALYSFNKKLKIRLSKYYKEALTLIRLEKEEFDHQKFNINPRNTYLLNYLRESEKATVRATFSREHQLEQEEISRTDVLNRSVESAISKRFSRCSAAQKLIKYKLCRAESVKNGESSLSNPPRRQVLSPFPKSTEPRPRSSFLLLKEKNHSNSIFLTGVKQEKAVRRWGNSVLRKKNLSTLKTANVKFQIGMFEASRQQRQEMHMFKTK